MALYQDGILISGANTLPKMTLAKYQALPVSERPTYWERTDLNYDSISAADVTYDNTASGLSATRVQGAIDEITVKYALVSFSIPDSGSSYDFTSLVPSGFYPTNSYVVSKMLYADAWYYDPTSLSVYTAGTAFLVSYPENYRGRQCKILLVKPSIIIQ